jgi:hypothetical protein
MEEVECEDPVWSEALTTPEASLVVKAVSKSSDKTRREVAENLRELIEEHQE